MSRPMTYEAACAIRDEAYECELNASVFFIPAMCSTYERSACPFAPVTGPVTGPEFGSEPDPDELPF